MNKKYSVKLSAADQTYIEQKMRDGKTPAGIRKRCMILIMADEHAGLIPTQEEIARRCQVSDVTVFQTIKGYCTLGIENVLCYQKRTDPPKQPIVTGEIEAHIIALACSTPPKGFSRWTIRLLAKRAVELEIIDSIGRETVRTTLKKHNLNRI